MKHVSNDSTKRPGIKLAIEWMKGLKMDIPYSRWVMFAIGVYILAAAFDKAVNGFSVLLVSLP